MVGNPSIIQGLTIEYLDSILELTVAIKFVIMTTTRVKSESPWSQHDHENVVCVCAEDDLYCHFLLLLFFGFIIIVGKFKFIPAQSCLEMCSVVICFDMVCYVSFFSSLKFCLFDAWTKLFKCKAYDGVRGWSGNFLIDIWRSQVVTCFEWSYFLMLIPIIMVSYHQGSA